MEVASCSVVWAIMTFVGVILLKAYLSFRKMRHGLKDFPSPPIQHWLMGHATKVNVQRTGNKIRTIKLCLW
jgi:hypothetical protein